jgi:hypothetical protein
MTDFTQSETDPGFFWQAMHCVVGESLAGDDPATAVAQLLFAQSALAGIQLDWLADHSGRSTTELLADVHRDYLAA